MRLLLDEHHEAKVAGRLRELGHEVVAVAERGDLRGMPDAVIFAIARGEERAIVTENARDYVELARQASDNNEHHFGVVITAPEAYPRRPDARTRLVEALARLLTEHLEVDALRDGVMWL